MLYYILYCIWKYAQLLSYECLFTDQLPPSIGDAPPDYYDIYPDKDFEPSPVDVSSPGNATTTDTDDNAMSTDNNNTESPDLSRTGTNTHYFCFNEVSNILCRIFA